MAQTIEFTIGADARCRDGDCGEVIRVVVDPVTRSATHLVVEPKHLRGFGRLVPLDLVEATTGEVRLRCTVAEFEKLDSAEEMRLVPGGYGSYGPGQVSAWPNFAPGGGIGMGNISRTVTYDTVPLGEVAIRRGEQVHATDGAIGRVQGLVIDSRNYDVTHVMLQEGHLWGRREVAIPIGVVTGVGDDGIRLTLTKQQVQDLPPRRVDHPAG
jgi:sporulation protein YlmC with PRC-barrel domain